MASRTYTASLPGGAATTTVQIQAKSTLKMICVSLVSAAAGSVEVSLNAASQIATGQPAADVICRCRVPGVAGTMFVEWPVNVPLVAFQNVYIHQTGAGNVGEVALIV